MTAPSALRSRLARLEPPRRVPGIDLARGLAVVGMLAAHLLVLPDLRWGEPSTWAGLASGRSSILFATLAGVSLALATAGRPLPSVRASTAARGLVLWALGLAVVGLDAPVHVILPAYGLLFLAAATVLGMTTRALLLLAAALAVAAPFAVAAIDVATPPGLLVGEDAWRNLTGWQYPFVLWTAFVAAGLGVGRLLRAALVATAARLVPVGAGLAVLGYGIVGPAGEDAAARRDLAQPADWTWVLQDAPHSSGVGEALGSGGFALATVGVCVLLARTPLGTLLWPLRAIGSMPLTAYVAHLLGWGLWIDVAHPADPLVGFRALDPFWPTTAALAVGCGLWAVLVGRGPLEALVARIAAPPPADRP